jgi:adenylosuccinate synthase
MKIKLDAVPVRVADLADDATLVARVDRALQHHNPLRKGLGIEPVDREALLNELRAIAPQLLPYAGTSLESVERA